MLLLGIGFCFVMYWWQLRYRYAFHDPTGNLLLAIPFAGLAAICHAGPGELGVIRRQFVHVLETVSASTGSGNGIVLSAQHEMLSGRGGLC